MKTVLITGASSGIGEASVELFASKGYKVIGLDRYAPEKPKATDFYKVDLSKMDQLENFIAKFKTYHKKLDVLVNNAAAYLHKPAIEVTMDEYEYVQAVNARAPYFLSTSLFPLLEKTQGSIVNVSSVHAVATCPNFSAYAVSKGGLTAMTRSLALEFGHAKVRVNAVLPGFVHTPLSRYHVSTTTDAGKDEKKIDEEIEKIGSKIVLQRSGEPIDIANAILFFVQNNDYTTGQTLTVDGGNMALFSSV